MHTFQSAQFALELLPSTQVTRCSSLYETAPVGGPVQSDYLNAVFQVQTSLEPSSLLLHMLDIEQQFGRDRRHEERWGPRSIDLDLLLYRDDVLCIDTPVELQVPHPRLHQRRFVLIPLVELAPHMIHPIYMQTLRSLLDSCPDRSPVLPYVQ